MQQPALAPEGFVSVMKETKCPSCGRVVLLDELKRETHHEAPICDGWRELMAETGGQRAGVLVLTNQGAAAIGALAVPCPECSAEAHAPCTGPHGWMFARVHEARHHLAQNGRQRP